jgi:hypothetical protein
VIAVGADVAAAFLFLGHSTTYFEILSIYSQLRNNSSLGIKGSKAR